MKRLQPDDSDGVDHFLALEQNVCDVVYMVAIFFFRNSRADTAHDFLLGVVADPRPRTSIFLSWPDLQIFLRKKCPQTKSGQLKKSRARAAAAAAARTAPTIASPPAAGATHPACTKTAGVQSMPPTIQPVTNSLAC